MSGPSPVFLSAADNWLEGFVRDSNGSVQKSLVLSLLFNDQIRISDEFFLVNRNLVAWVLRKPSLFAEAIKERIIVPSFRESSAEDFADAFEYFEKRHSYIFDITKTNKEIAREAATRLQQLTKEATNLVGMRHPGPTHWSPQEAAEGFLRLVQTYLRNDEAYLNATVDDKEATKRQAALRKIDGLRFEIIDKAVKRTERDSPGLRRSALFQVLKEEYGIADDARVGDFQDLFSLIKRNPARGRFTVDQVRTFTEWCNDLYHLERARQLGAACVLPAYSIRNGGAASGVYWRRADAEAGSEVLRNATGKNPLIVEMKLPSIRALLTIDPAVVLRARRIHIGPYLQAVRVWQMEPTAEREVCLRSNAQAYAAALCDCITKDRSSKAFQNVKQEYSSKDVMRFAMEAATVAAGTSLTSARLGAPELVSLGGSVCGPVVLMGALMATARLRRRTVWLEMPELVTPLLADSTECDPVLAEVIMGRRSRPARRPRRT